MQTKINNADLRFLEETAPNHIKVLLAYKGMKGRMQHETFRNGIEECNHTLISRAVDGAADTSITATGVTPPASYNLFELMLGGTAITTLSTHE